MTDIKSTVSREAMTSSLPLLLLVLCSLSVAQADLKVFNMRAEGLSGDASGPPDPYVVVVFGSGKASRTSVRKDNANPWWNEELYDSYAKLGDRLKFRVYDEDVYSDDLLGECDATVSKGTNGESCGLSSGGTFYYQYTFY